MLGELSMENGPHHQPGLIQAAESTHTGLSPDSRLKRRSHTWPHSHLPTVGLAGRTGMREGASNLGARATAALGPLGDTG